MIFNRLNKIMNQIWLGLVLYSPINKGFQEVETKTMCFLKMQLMHHTT